MFTADLQKIPKYRRHWAVNFAATAATIAGVLLLSSCGTKEERSYPAPHTLCGTPVSPTIIEPLLPPGKSITEDLQEWKSPFDRYSFCRINVDGQRILSVNKQWYARGFTLTQVASSPRGVRVDDHYSEDGSYAYSDKGGVSRATCPRPDTVWKREQGQLFVVVRSSDPVQPNKSAMKNLVLGYAKAVGASSECN